MLPALITLSACIPLAALIGYVIGVRIERRRNSMQDRRYWQPSMYVDPETTPEMYKWAPQDRFN